MQTKLLYLSDLHALDCTATVVDSITEAEKSIVMLDQTVFYPQGGGQPYDTGTIENSSAKFIVTEVRFVDGFVRHIGHFEQGSFAVGDTVECHANKERRKLNSQLHSAGHIVDMAVARLKLGWVPGKAFHFPEGPYVEYSGNLEGVDKEALQKELEAVSNQIIKENFETKLLFMPKEEMNTVCHSVPDYLPAGKPARVVMYGSFGIPCGGTHVAHAAEIKGITIRKIKLEKGALRVSYDIVR